MDFSFSSSPIDEEIALNSRESIVKLLSEGLLRLFDELSSLRKLVPHRSKKMILLQETLLWDFPKVFLLPSFSYLPNSIGKTSTKARNPTAQLVVMQTAVENCI